MCKQNLTIDDIIKAMSVCIENNYTPDSILIGQKSYKLLKKLVPYIGKVKVKRRTKNKSQWVWI